MAFTIPGTFTVGEQPPASKLNTLVTAIGELQTAVRFGVTNVLLTSGAGSVTHGCPFTPVGVIVTPFLGTIYVGVGVTAITATTFSIRAFKSFTNADYFTGGALTIYWAAFA